MIKVEVYFFATIRSQIGERKIELEIPAGFTVKELKQLISERYPDAEGAIQVMLAAVNREFSAEDTVIPAGAEIAFFPHVSGGNHSGRWDPVPDCV
ncbi:MAG: MoaD/ThiS family protein [Anaerolineales bacterium]|nr:MoaD/ThiS family protein [Anaerolineales bacterium]